MSDLIKDNRPILIIITIGTFALALAIGIFGVVLVYKGATGDTEFTFFGHTFKSTNVGISALFLAAAMTVLLIRRTLKSVDLTTNKQGEMVRFTNPQQGVGPTSKLLQTAPPESSVTNRKEISETLYSNCLQWAHALLQTFDDAVLRWENEGQSAAEDEIMALVEDFMKIDYWSLKDSSPLLLYLKEDTRFSKMADACSDFYHSALDVKRIAYGDIEKSPNKYVSRSSVGLKGMVHLWKAEVERMLERVTREYHTIRTIE